MKHMFKSTMMTEDKCVFIGVVREGITLDAVEEFCNQEFSIRWDCKWDAIEDEDGVIRVYVMKRWGSSNPDKNDEDDGTHYEDCKHNWNKGDMKNRHPVTDACPECEEEDEDE